MAVGHSEPFETQPHQSKADEKEIHSREKTPQQQHGALFEDIRE
jgi:hypothetical protein